MKSMRKVQLLLCMLLMMGTIVMRAQDQRSAVDVLVDVIVVDKQGDGLPGATVKVTGRPVAVVSNLDGKVSLWVHRGDKITISYLGMQPRVFTINKPLTGKIT